MSCAKYNCPFSSFIGSKALNDAGISYTEVDQAVVGYCYGQSINPTLYNPLQLASSFRAKQSYIIYWFFR